MLSTLVFSYNEQERFDSQLWYFPSRESSALLLRTTPMTKKKQFKSTPTWSPGCVSLTKTVTESIPVCSAVGGSYGSTRHLSSFLIHPPFQLFVVLWWCVSCVLLRCSPHHHHHHHHRHITGRGGGTLVPKKRNKTQPICYVWCPKSSINAAPHPQAKVYSVVCVLELSSVHSLVGQ